MAVVAADIWRDTRWRERPQSFERVGLSSFWTCPPVGAEFNRCCRLTSFFRVCINKALLKLGVTRGPPHSHRHTHTHTHTHTPSSVSEAESHPQPFCWTLPASRQHQSSPSLPVVHPGTQTLHPLFFQSLRTLPSPGMYPAFFVGAGEVLNGSGSSPRHGVRAEMGRSFWRHRGSTQRGAMPTW